MAITNHDRVGKAKELTWYARKGGNPPSTKGTSFAEIEE